MDTTQETAPSPATAPTAFERRHGTQFPTSASHFFCRQKQYYAIASSVQFLHPFITRAAETAETSVTASCDAEDPLATLLREFYPRLAGAPASLKHDGPLALGHVTALQSASDAQVFALFRSFRWVPAAFHARLGVETPLFPTSSALTKILWDPSSGMTERFAAAIRAARADKPKYYRELSRDGYLCEPGLHALRVFAPSLNAAPTPPTPSLAVAEDSGDTGGGQPAVLNATSLSLADLPAGRMSAVQEAYWHRLIEAYSLCLPDRSHIHELENLPQEIAIGELLAEITGVAVPVPVLDADGTVAAESVDALFASAPSSMLDCVVDVGGGNAFLAAEVGERLGCDSVVIDPHYPPHSVDCCPRMWPDTTARVRPSRSRRFVIHRKIAFFKEIDFRRDIPAEPGRCAFIAKHLCGTAVDECLRHLEAQDCWPRVLVLVPCCFHKGQFDTYVNAPYLREVMQVDSQDAYTRMTKLTDWNRSIYQRAELDGSLESAEAEKGSGSSGDTRKRPRKSHHKARTIDHLVCCQEAMAAGVEALMNRGRMLWLQERGYEVRLLEYVPDFVTPKNKCIVAVRRAS